MFKIMSWVAILGAARLFLVPTPLAYGIEDILDPGNRYDFIVLVHESLANAALPLTTDPSLRTCMVTDSEVLAAFGEDSLTVDDLREFVEYAYGQWSIAPTYLLLVGDVAMDEDPDPPVYFGYLPSFERENNWDCGGNPCEYVDDGWIVTPPAFGTKPLMHVGRIPARDPLVLSQYVSKLEYYKYQQPEAAPWLGEVLVLVGDRGDNAIMRTYANDLVAEELSAWETVTTLYSADYSSAEWPDAATQDTRDAWNTGCGLINSLGNAGREGLPTECELVYMARSFCAPGPTFTQQLGATMKFPVMFSATCLAHYFFRRSDSNPNDPYCVADDVLLSTSDRGAVASFASCHVTPAFENYLMNKIFLDLFTRKGIRDLGRLCTATELEYERVGVGAEFVPQEFCLLGDPTIRVKIPQCWGCLEEDYMKKWISGAEIEDTPIQQEKYLSDPVGMSYPNLRIIHSSGGVIPPCGERMVRATARDENGSGQVVWNLAETYFDINPNSMLIFRMCIPQSPGDGGNVCIDAQHYGGEEWLSSHAGTFDQFGNGLDPASRPPLTPGWHTFYVDLTAFVDVCWYQEISSIALRYENNTSTPGSLEVYIDDIQFRKTNAWRGEILNPDFEEDADADGKPDFWTDLDGEASSVVSVWDDFAYSGQYAMRVCDQPAENQGAKQLVHLNHETERYWFSFMVRANLETEVNYCVRRVDTGETLCGWYGGVSREWRKLGCVFDNPWYTGSSYGVDLVSVEILPPAGGVIYVDSVSVVPPMFGTVETEYGPVPRRTNLTIAPNPANPTCEIQFELRRGGDISVVIYDVSGRLISEIAAASFARGTHRRVWEGRDTNGNPVASGIYFCRLMEGKRAITKKIVVIR